MTLKRTFAILAVLSMLACVSNAANTYVETVRAHTAAGAFGCTVSGATVATPSVITCTAAHGLIDGEVQITGIVGTTTDNTTAYVKVTGYSTTTFALYVDSGFVTGVTGTGAYSSGGKVSIAKDVSTLSGDFTLRVNINGLTATKNVVACVQDSTDGFVADIVNLWCVGLQGGSSTGFYVPAISHSTRMYQVPSARIGVANARMRLNVSTLDIGATLTVSWFIEQ
jgi:hypothetical protein